MGRQCFDLINEDEDIVLECRKILETNEVLLITLPHSTGQYVCEYCWANLEDSGFEDLSLEDLPLQNRVIFRRSDRQPGDESLDPMSTNGPVDSFDFFLGELETVELEWKSIDGVDFDQSDSLSSLDLELDGLGLNVERSQDAGEFFIDTPGGPLSFLQIPNLRSRHSGYIPLDDTGGLLMILKSAPKQPKTLVQVSILRNLAEVRGELYYLFGLLCLGSWFVFNLWILRDYFFPWWFAPIYTETGLRKRKLELKKREYVMRSRMSNAFNISTTIAMPQYPQDCISLPMDAPREPRKTSSVDGVLFG
ncbi:hypothetical protein QR680_005002 [Steinernema hermaphroditum]|uniref:Uncharacterized protein n=1 Tax=Steinernema hermaphroditum TaxID=289476 RepID=A0AA39LUX2_9BILA|nr:hypothetical protein QR680_005002 [Steinernema hermaphroditum]